MTPPHVQEAHKDHKRKAIESEGAATPKKRKITTDIKQGDVPDHNFNQSEDTNNDIPVYTTKAFSKNKGMSTEDSEAERKKQMEYLNKFVNISMKYAAFLEGKVSTGSPSTSSKTEQESANAATIRPDVMERLSFFKGELRPYQQEGVTWLTVLYENSVNGILGDEMGLGKTIQIIALLCHLYERKVQGPFLIVAPLSTLGNWRTEFERFAPELPLLVFHGTANERQELKHKFNKSFRLEGQVVRPVVVTSYQMPLMERSFFGSSTWQYIIVDEGHKIKNHDSKLSQELRALKSINRTLLTGTPLQNDIKELWALLHFLMPRLFQNHLSFSALLELDNLKDKNKVLEDEASSHLISKIQKTLSPFMLRREKTDVLPDLVPKKEVIISCRLTEMQRYIYLAILRKDSRKLMMMEKIPEVVGKRKRKPVKARYFGIEDEDADGQKVSNGGRFVANNKGVPIDCPNCAYVCSITMQSSLSMMRKIVNHPYLIWCPIKPNSRSELYVSEELIQHSGKLQVLDAMLPKLQANGHKILIFSTSVMFMDIIEEMLIMRNYMYTRLDGGTNLAQREENINDFCKNQDSFIFLISTRAGGLGLNLTAADTVIFMDRDWNPMCDLQAQDRCHRIGQTKPVMIFSLITKNTVDEIILDRGEVKRRLEKIIIKEGKFKHLKREFSDNELKELEEILNKEEKRDHIYPNGLFYSEEDFLRILDRSELYEKMNMKR